MASTLQFQCSETGCTHTAWVTCQVCGVHLCTMHATALVRPYANYTPMPVILTVGQFRQSLSPNTSGTLRLSVCRICHTAISRQPKWNWDGPRYGRSPLQDLVAKETTKGTTSATEMWESIAAVAKITMSSPKKPVQIVGEKKKPEDMPPPEAPEEVDPQMQRLLDLLDSEVL